MYSNPLNPIKQHTDTHSNKQWQTCSRA